MTLEQAKQELVKRYKYLYENAYFILAPFMHEQTEQEYKAYVEELKKDFGEKGAEILKEPLIYLNIKRTDYINSLFEEFLLSDKPMEESSLYQIMEDKRNDKDYLERVKYGLALDARCKTTKSRLSIGEILRLTSDYIEEQSGGLRNKERKLYVLDQYYRVLRYRNNGKIYTSGRKLNLHDVDSIVIPLNNRAPFREKNDIGVTKNAFTTAIATAPCYEDNCSIFTESEKQQIYLNYHDELPYDLEIACELEQKYTETPMDTRLQRPENTNPCNEHFFIKEEEIFVNPSDQLYRYYQLCPHCGFIVNIPKEILSEGIKQRIEDRCSKDDKLFRKMFLYSELFSLDKSSTNGQKKLLRK